MKTVFAVRFWQEGKKPETIHLNTSKEARGYINSVNKLGFGRAHFLGKTKVKAVENGS